MKTVAQQFTKTLKEIGVKYVFGVPSGNMIHYMEALRLQEGIEFVTVGHEATAAIMADVCGRITGIPGVCFGTFGPGATNLSTGVGGALLDRSPVIAFTDEMPDHLLKRTVQMNIDHQALFKPITKWTTRLQTSNIKETILKAASIACNGVPGPVHIGVPAGIAEMQAPDSKFLSEEEDICLSSEEAIAKFKTAFLVAKKPILAVGLSAVRAGVSEHVKEFIERFSIPVVLTPMAKGMLSEDHPLYVGVLFHALSNIVAETYKQADLIIGVGYDPVEFNYEDWIPNVPVVHIDNVPADLDAVNCNLATDVVGDLHSSLKMLMEMLPIENEWDIKKIKDRKERMFKVLSPLKNSWGPRAVVDGLRGHLPSEGILTVDVGAHLHLVGQQWLTPSPEKLIMTNGWSSMGFAIPAAMAAKICNPELPVACILGDGGFFMTAGELATVKRLGLPIVFVVIVDNSLSLIEIKQQKKQFNSSYGTELNPQNYFTAESYFGIPVLKAKEKDTYKQVLQEAFRMGKPVLIEAHVDGSEYKDLVLKPNK